MGSELRLFTKIVEKDWHLLCSSSLFAETDKRVIYYVQELQRPCQEFRLAIWKCVENHPTHAPLHSGVNPNIWIAVFNYKLTLVYKISWPKNPPPERNLGPKAKFAYVSVFWKASPQFSCSPRSRARPVRATRGAARNWG